MRVALVAGEASGDLLGAGLIRALRAVEPAIECEGVAGPEMSAAGCVALEKSDVLAVMGLIEPLREIPKLLRLRRSLIARWTAAPPDVFVGIDAPDFNLGLELKLRKQGVRTVHYVSPSVWAWRQGRVRKIAKAVDRVLCLLPFEKTFYDEHGVAAEFVGHPLADRLPENPDIAAARAVLGIDTEPLVAVLPGSRHSEVSRLGPVFAEAAAMLARDIPDISFVAPMVSASIREEFQRCLDAAGITERFRLTDGLAETVVTAADVVLLASGTATLQAALLGKPMVAAYRFARATFALGTALKLVNVPFFSLPNLLTDEPLVPEFLQDQATPEALATAVGELLRDSARREHIAAAFHSLRNQLARGADRRAAAAVLQVARQPRKAD
jgi:lipid-A-disaccharide synthase